MVCGLWLVGEWIEIIFLSLPVFAGGELRSTIIGAQGASPADGILATSPSLAAQINMLGLLLVWGIREIYSVGCLWFVFCAMENFGRLD
jgi:hypothetical protein